MIKLFNRNNKKRAKKNAIFNKKTERDYKNAVLSEKSNFSVSEGYKTTRTNIVYALSNCTDKCKKIIFTSSVPTEGKTVSCLNTAISFAMTDCKVLIVDADLRKPKIHTCFGMKNDVGLTSYLAGFAKFEDIIQKNKEHKIDCITSGHVPPNPSELLASPKMNEFFAKVSEIYDYVFIDMPPTLLVADAVSLSKYVTGVVIVVRDNFTNKDNLRKTVADLQFANANILGFVLNDITKKEGYYSNKYKYKYLRYKYSEYRS